MNIKQLKEIALHAKDTGYPSDEADQLIAELDNYERLMKTDDDLWHGQIYLIDTNDLIDVLNQLTYDDYGVLYRGNDNKEPAFDAYTNYIRMRHDLKGFTDEMLQIGFDLIRDLYSDNESSGFNTPEGFYDESAGN